MKTVIGLLVLMLCLMGCASDKPNNANAGNDAEAARYSIGSDDTYNAGNSLDDQLANIEGDTLAPQTQPRLQIDAQPEGLLLSWSAPAIDQIATIYEYNLATRQETLILGNIASDQNTLIVPSKSAIRPWHAQQFRVELCNALDCVSSDRISISSLLAATTQVIRPSVFLQDEHFAQSIAASDNAAVVFTSMPVEGTVQVYFHNQTRWISASSIRLVPAYSLSIASMDSSADGNTLAVLIKAAEHNAWQPGMRIIERLGETWVVTSGLSLPMNAAVNDQTSVILSANGDQVLVGTSAQVMIYQRTNVDWTLSRQVTLPSGSTLAAVSVDNDFNQLQLLRLQNEQLWLHTGLIGSGTESGTDSGFRAGSSTGTTPQLSFDQQPWLDGPHTLVQGIDATDEVRLKSNTDGASVVVAGWDNAVAAERSPVLWHLSISHDAQGSSGGLINVLDSLRAAPTPDLQARLRFSASDTLDTVALGWNNGPGDDAMLTTFTYSDRERGWQSALALPETLPALAKQAFAGQTLLSADGQTLLIATPAGRASPAVNRVGELLVIR